MEVSFLGMVQEKEKETSFRGCTATRQCSALSNRNASSTPPPNTTHPECQVGMPSHARFRLGHFDDPERIPYSKIPASVVGSQAHLVLAREAALKSIVLLKNEPTEGKGKPLLPLDVSLLKKVGGPSALPCMYASSGMNRALHVP